MSGTGGSHRGQVPVLAQQEPSLSLPAALVLVGLTAPLPRRQPPVRRGLDASPASGGKSLSWVSLTSSKSPQWDGAFRVPRALTLNYSGATFHWLSPFPLPSVLRGIPSHTNRHPHPCLGSDLEVMQVLTLVLQRSPCLAFEARLVL